MLFRVIPGTPMQSDLKIHGCGVGGRIQKINDKVSRYINMLKHGGMQGPGQSFRSAVVAVSICRCSEPRIPVGCYTALS